MSLAGCGIQQVIFTTYTRTLEDEATAEGTQAVVEASIQHAEYRRIWETHYPDVQAGFEPTIEGTLLRVRRLGQGCEEMQVLITGSQHLVGGALLNFMNPASEAGVQECE